MLHWKSRIKDSVLETICLFDQKLLPPQKKKERKEKNHSGIYELFAWICSLEEKHFASDKWLNW